MTSPPEAPTGPPPRVLLVWDAPNMDMSLGTLLGARPTSAFRPRFDAVGRWLLELAGPVAVAEATVFTNVVPGSTEVVRPWVEALRNVGFAVFAKPKIADDSDVDDDMLAHIALREDEGALRHVVVASGDGRAFREPLENLVAHGTSVTVIGFREHATFALSSEVIEFIDLEDIDGVFREPLPRITLDSLPDTGAWLPPFRSLRSLLEPRR
ncbi:MAG: NYN domain-containing protein [Pseudonocardia sp.]